MAPSGDYECIDSFDIRIVTVIPPIDHQISLFLFYSSLQVIWKYLFRIMPFNIRTKISLSVVKPLSYLLTTFQADYCHV